MNRKEDLDKPMLVDQERLVVNKMYDVRPWSRFMARYIDLCVFSYLTGVLWGYIHYDSLERIHVIVLGIIICLAWVFVEALLIAKLGYTLGKWLFRIKVRDEEGNKLTFSKARARGIRVLLRGMGLEIPLISFFTKLFAYMRLKDTGTTTWDEAVNSRVTYGHLSVIRRIILTIIVCLFLYLIWMSK